MAEPRLRADIWVAAYLARLSQAAIPAFVTARGDATAGAVLVVVSTLIPHTGSISVAMVGLLGYSHGV